MYVSESDAIACLVVFIIFCISLVCEACYELVKIRVYKKKINILNTRSRFITINNIWKQKISRAVRSNFGENALKIIPAIS